MLQSSVGTMTDTIHACAFRDALYVVFYSVIGIDSHAACSHVQANHSDGSSPFHENFAVPAIKTVGSPSLLTPCKLADREHLCNTGVLLLWTPYSIQYPFADHRVDRRIMNADEETLLLDAIRLLARGLVLHIHNPVLRPLYVAYSHVVPGVSTMTFLGPVSLDLGPPAKRRSMSIHPHAAGVSMVPQLVCAQGREPNSNAEEKRPRHD
mmetsp:Transcript_213/g.484  ORF Transcript_213/g.484 Transcript_213/m.484 type:complete len:209 (+) Transcript_213:715-1341(+)